MKTLENLTINGYELRIVDVNGRLYSAVGDIPRGDERKDADHAERRRLRDALRKRYPDKNIRLQSTRSVLEQTESGLIVRKDRKGQIIASYLP